MKKLALVLVTLLILVIVITGCGEKSTSTTSSAPAVTTTSSTSKPASTTSQAPATTTTTSVNPMSATTSKATPSTSTSAAPTTKAPKKGGTLRVLAVNGPTNLSYVPEQNMSDETFAKAYAETLVFWAGNGEFMPQLAKSWDMDAAKKTITFHLQEGVTFHDGTPFNAEAVRWNVQLLIDNKRLANGQYVDSIQVIDEYTFRYNLNGWMSPQIMLHSYGYNLMTM